MPASPEVGGPRESLDASIARALPTNPQVLIAQSNQYAAQAGIDFAYAGLMPTVSVSAQLEHLDDQQIERDHIDSAGVLGTLTVPIYQAGAEYSKIRQNKETFTQNQNNPAAAQRTATQVTTQAWENLQAARANVQSFQAQIEAINPAVDLVDYFVATRRSLVAGASSCRPRSRPACRRA